MFPHTATDSIRHVYKTAHVCVCVCEFVWERIYIIIVCECRTTIRFTQLGKRMPSRIYEQYNTITPLSVHTQTGTLITLRGSNYIRRQLRVDFSKKKHQRLYYIYFISRHTRLIQYTRVRDGGKRERFYVSILFCNNIIYVHILRKSDVQFPHSGRQNVQIPAQHQRLNSFTLAHPDPMKFIFIK